jgi:UDP-3-O-[3-hydroxymyristoyl] glucosamine N-acyltransferase
MAFKITVAEIFAEFQPTGILINALGDNCTLVQGISAIELCKPGDLVFVDKPEYVQIVQERAPAAVVTTAALSESLASLANLAVLIAPNVGLAHAMMKQKYGARDYSLSGWQDIHPSAVLHESALIGTGTVVEPNVVIAQDVKIGARCRIMAGTVIENNAVLGNDVILHPRVTIGYACELGDQVMIGSGTVIGSEGYGFAQDRQRKSHAIPQTGIVVIEDRVRIGSNCSIDRATYHETRIGAGTKIDNLCHIAHNVQVGKDCLLTAMLCVAGSTSIGDRVITSGQTGILDHMKICSDTVLLHRAGVTKPVDKPGAYAGLPLQPLSEYMRNMAVLRSATELRQRIADLEKQISEFKNG